jgi:LacI family transcriptional regulator
MLLGDQAMGIVIAGGVFADVEHQGGLSEAVASARKHGTSVIFLADRGLEGVSVIDVDNRGVLEDAVGYLLQLGHRRIAYVPGPSGFSTETRRRDGYIRAMTGAGLEPFVVAGGGFDHLAGRTAAAAIAAGPLPDAVICFGEELAIGALIGFRSFGVAIPDDVSMMGIDGTRYSEVFDLSSVKVPTWELGMVAARMLINEETLPERVILPHQVISRSTTRSLVSAAAPVL